MTALEKYIRLESLGRWKETPQTAAKEVLVSFGNATLVLSDARDIPFSHWSLVATRLISKSGNKAIYSADDDSFETLEIDDPEMIKAITKISQAASSTRHRINWALSLVIIMLIAAGYSAYRFGPTLLLEQAIRMTSQDSARQFSSQIISQMHLQQCREEQANQALRKLEGAVFPDGDFKLVIVRNGPSGMVLPGGIVLLEERRLKEFPAAATLAHWLKVNSENTINYYSATDLLEGSTYGELITYATSGKMPEHRISNVIDQVLQNYSGKNLNPPPQPDNTTTLQDKEWLAIYNICLL